MWVGGNDVIPIWVQLFLHQDHHRELPSRHSTDNQGVHYYHRLLYYYQDHRGSLTYITGKLLHDPMSLDILRVLMVLLDLNHALGNEDYHPFHGGLELDQSQAIERLSLRGHDNGMQHPSHSSFTPYLASKDADHDVNDDGQPYIANEKDGDEHDGAQVFLQRGEQSRSSGFHSQHLLHHP